MNNLMFSILIPVYNTPKEYMKRSLDSVFKQKCNSDYEVIVYDDGSKNINEIKEVIDEYNIKYKNKIKFYSHNINKGLLITRFDQFKLANGLYSLILDSDDELPENTLKIYETWFDYNKNEFPDIIKGSVDLINSKYEIERKTITTDTIIKCTNNIEFANIFYKKINKYNLWSNLFKTKTLKKVSEKYYSELENLNITIEEDTLITFLIVRNSLYYVSINDLVYIYYVGIGITNKDKYIKTLEDWDFKCSSYKVINYIFNYIDSHSELEKHIKEHFENFKFYLTLRLYYFLIERVDKSIYEDAKNLFIEKFAIKNFDVL